MSDFRKPIRKPLPKPQAPDAAKFSTNFICFFRIEELVKREYTAATIAVANLLCCVDPKDAPIYKIGRKRLAKLTGLSERSVTRSLKILETDGFVKVVTPGDSASHTFATYDVANLLNLGEEARNFKSLTKIAEVA